MSFTYVRRAGCLRRGILPVLFRAFRAQSYCGLRHRSRFIAFLQALLQAAVYILETLPSGKIFIFCRCSFQWHTCRKRCSRTFRRWETSRFTGLYVLVVGISEDSAELFEEHEPLFIQRLETVSIVPDHVVPRQSTTCLLVLSNSDLARGPLSWHTPQIKTRVTAN